MGSEKVIEIILIFWPIANSLKIKQREKQVVIFQIFNWRVKHIFSILMYIGVKWSACVYELNISQLYMQYMYRYFLHYCEAPFSVQFDRSWKRVHTIYISKMVNERCSKRLWDFLEFRMLRSVYRGPQTIGSSDARYINEKSRNFSYQL